MTEPRPSMLYVQQSAAQQEQAQGQPQSEPRKPGMLPGMEGFFRAVWTMTCFTVFCGFSFFLGWHLRGWHFSAYYEAPAVDLMGAKTAYHAPVIRPPADISQAVPEGQE